MNFLRSLYLKNRLFYLVGMLVFCFIAGNFIPFFEVLGMIGLVVAFILILAETAGLYLSKGYISGFRDVPDKLSNGDDNSIYIHLQNKYNFAVVINVLDELPVQFQLRDKQFNLVLEKGEEKTISYALRPTERGEYHFGVINIYAESKLGFVSRRFKLGEEEMVPVYPGFLQLKKYEFFAISNHLTAYGLKKIRKIGHNYEFDQIRNYVPGDDVRSINWKATARTGDVMINQFQDEKAQNIYCVINMGRIMKMPFNGLSLLDHSINSSLVLLNVALKKDDKAGLLTFNQQPVSFLAAEKRQSQLRLILETLYNQTTSFGEANYEAMYYQVRKNISQRSLLLFYTNFEGRSSLDRELPYLRKLATRHVVVVIFFKNTEVNKLLAEKANSIEDIYVQTIANKFMFEKKMIVNELKRWGIHTILADPNELTIASINKYLELKKRGVV